MDPANGKLTVSLKHCYAKDSHVLKLSPASISEIENIFNVESGSCECIIPRHNIYLGESKRKEILHVYWRDGVLNNTINDNQGDGAYTKYIAPVEDLLSRPGLYDVVVEYEPPQSVVLQPTTAKKPKGNILEQIWQILAPQTA